MRTCASCCSKKGTLEEFLNWLKRGRQGASLEKMAINLGKKQICKKNSTRKGSNLVKASVTQTIDILEQNSFTNKNKVLQSDMTEIFNLFQMSGVILSPGLNAMANQG